MPKKCLLIYIYVAVPFAVSAEMQDQRVKTNAAVIDIKPPPLESMVADRLEGKNGSMKRVKSPINAMSYTVAALQTATNSFSQEFLIGEGSLGRVYKGDLPNGKVISVFIASMFIPTSEVIYIPCSTFRVCGGLSIIILFAINNKG